MASPLVSVPRYGESTLSDLLPAVLAGLTGGEDPLGLGLTGVRRVCVLLIDGLGALQLAARAEYAPMLTSMRAGTLTSTFPSTTATSLASLGTGSPPGRHGIVGYLTAVEGYDRPMNPLHWRLHGQAGGRSGGDGQAGGRSKSSRSDLLSTLVPEEFQPQPTVFERAAAAGIAVTRVAPSYQQESGLTRAVLRGGEFAASVSAGDLVARTVSALGRGDRSLVYSYWSELDLTGHVRGPSSDAWSHELRQVDSIVEAVAARLLADAALVVTADHGMVDVADRVDVDTTPALSQDVTMIAGEPRARHVFARSGAASDVADRWQATLGEDYLVIGRDDAIDRGWFGPVRPAVARTIGDVLALALGSGAVVRSGAEPNQSALLGHHGSLTKAEVRIPLLIARG
ncbi:alkaline phosphatase family protein [Rhodococcoides corynebacterioides]|uniref:Alkaline phosphatase family protein n=1 Tax=Rhodococcoides corynebacterioides TaxID=53972 RepID=A0ABS7P203_9NOCA|nr:alkaline phosphatase family protein [Rhodococcus corynebacterioides]MBY6366436.1 alkaline phosphatase family protein [Rhodococcus corynebacterioides]MBY6407036.1 alkaline phosphatase family protein [Rhodococcus corynebacterioides]